MSCCKVRRGNYLGVVAIPAAALLATFFIGGWAQGKEGDDTTTAARLVEMARQAEVDGDVARHFALLRQAVSISPNYQAARSQLGHVQVDGKWLAVEEAQRRAAANPKQATYRELRAEHGASAEGQLALARWCRKNDLDEESRFHWASVLSVNPNHKEALRTLKMHWHEGQLLSREQIKQSRQSAVETKRFSRRWTIAVAGWERALSKKHDVTPTEVLYEIRAVGDVAAIPAFEMVTLDAREQTGSRNEGRRQLSLAFLDSLDAITDHVATQSLVRHAVLSQFSEVRDEASERLRKRPLHDVVPLLLDGLSARIESTFRVVADNDGSVHYLHSMYREGPFADWSHRESHSIHQQAAPERIAARLTGGIPARLTGDGNQLTVDGLMAEAAVRTTSAAAASRSAQRYEQEAVVAEQHVAVANERAEALNTRIVAVLARVTDEDFGTEPRPWWDWWQSYNEYDRSAARPVYETQDVSNEYVVPEVPVGPGFGGGRSECFAAGTPVWTKTGQRPIESLELGELVLAQNVETGELAYKPVIGRTVRPPSEIVNVSFGKETLRTTRGHPFWVADTGWRMAKELEDGAILRGVTGSARVAAVKSSGQAEAYNLVVAEFNTYFAGEIGVLVHDNTPRRPTRASVPGLAAK